MEWLKKHWGWIAAVAVGIPVLYWLYQAYQTNAANNAQTAQQTDLVNQEQADQASYAQQIALANLSGGIGSSGVSGSVSSSAPVTSTVASPANTSSPTVSSSSAPVVSSGSNVYGNPSDPYLITSGPNAGEYNFPSGGPPGETPVPNPNAAANSVSAPAVNTPAKSQTYGTVTTLLGTGAAAIQQNQTAPPRAPVMTTPPAHIATGNIEQHNNILPVPPTSKELSSIANGEI